MVTTICEEIFRWNLNEYKNMLLRNTSIHYILSVSKVIHSKNKILWTYSNTDTLIQYKM
jgi:hypothetical protein